MFYLNTSLVAYVNTKFTQILNFEQLNQYEFYTKSVSKLNTLQFIPVRL